VPFSNLTFFSTTDGNIYYYNSQQLLNHNVTKLPGTHHLGNTFLSLSPDHSFLCSTDQYSGLVSIWSVASRALLYEL
jgi:WD40 repeat protein